MLWHQHGAVNRLMAWVQTKAGLKLCLNLWRYLSQSAMYQFYFWEFFGKCWISPSIQLCVLCCWQCTHVLNIFGATHNVRCWSGVITVTKREVSLFFSSFSSVVSFKAVIPERYEWSVCCFSTSCFPVVTLKSSHGS